MTSSEVEGHGRDFPGEVFKGPIQGSSMYGTDVRVDIIRLTWWNFE